MVKPEAGTVHELDGEKGLGRRGVKGGEGRG